MRVRAVRTANTVACNLAIERRRRRRRRTVVAVTLRQTRRRCPSGLSVACLPRAAGHAVRFFLDDSRLVYYIIIVVYRQYKLLIGNRRRVEENFVLSLYSIKIKKIDRKFINRASAGTKKKKKTSVKSL